MTARTTTRTTARTTATTTHDGVSGVASSPIYATAQYNFVPVRGQSNSIGSASPALTISPVTNAWMLSATRSPVNSATSFTAMQESSVVNIESPSSPFAGQVAQMLSDLGISTEHNIVAGSYGDSGIAIALLVQGQTIYEAAEAGLVKSVALASGIGKTCVNSAWMWYQGEADSGNPIAGYKATFLDMKSDWESDAAVATGQTLPPLCITYQVRSGNQNVGLYELMRDNAGITMACPSYHLPFADSVHYTSHGVRHLAAYMAKAYVRNVVQNNPWKPLYPISVTVTDNQVIEITFNVPGTKLVWDFTQTGSGPASASSANPTTALINGFSVVHSDLVVRDIADIEITAANKVVITMASASLSNGDVLRYSSGTIQYRTVTSGTLYTGTYGNLRDVGDAINTAYQDGSGNDYLLDNWCVGFEETLSI